MSKLVSDADAATRLWALLQDGARRSAEIARLNGRYIITAEAIQQHLDDLDAIISEPWPHTEPARFKALPAELVPVEQEPEPIEPEPPQPPAVEPSLAEAMAAVTADRDAMRAKLLADLECDDWVRVAVAAQALGISEQCVRDHCLKQLAIEQPELRSFPIRRVGLKQMFEVGLTGFKKFMSTFREADVARRRRQLAKSKKAASKNDPR